MSIAIALTVNGKSVSAEVSPDTLLVDFLRDHLNLTGTHVGCDTSQCGACTVHLDGTAIKSCTMLAVQADARDVLTIEGIGDRDNLHPMQAAFRQCHGLQCGFCTPSMIMSAIDLVNRTSDLTNENIRKGLEGNICRCTGYQNIVKAVETAAKEMEA